MVFPPEPIHFSPKLAASGVGFFFRPGGGGAPSEPLPSGILQVRNNRGATRHQALVNIHLKGDGGDGIVVLLFLGVLFLYVFSPNMAHFFDGLSLLPLTANNASGGPVMRFLMGISSGGGLWGRGVAAGGGTD